VQLLLATGVVYVATPALLTLGAAQVLPGWIVNTEFNGNWSLPAMLVVVEILGCLFAVSFTASITGVACVATLLPGALSLVAPVVAVKVTLVVGSSAPPAVPGAV
jgi:hypothetical protein